MKNIHFIGIAGIGMSALAHICLSKGDAVSGSDIRSNNLTEGLLSKGAVINLVHDVKNIRPGIDMVIASSSIRNDNPEIIKARENSIPIIPRSEFLGMKMSETECSIAVTGTHGKTTTTAIIAHIAEIAGQDPTIALGGEIDLIGGNAKAGSGKMFVAEVDESDGFFRSIVSRHAVITNVEREHMENYKGWNDLVKTYESFIAKISSEGTLVYNGEDRGTKEILNAFEGSRKISFGMTENCDVTCTNEVFDKGIEFNILIKGKDRGRIVCPLLGKYNTMNLLAAIALSIEIGIDMKYIIEGARSFKGVKRRFEEIANIKGIRVVEDYAHHPTEIKAVIGAAKRFTEGKVIAIFQPHRYSRTRDLAEEFSTSFNEADSLILTDIYSADEDNSDKMSVQDIVKKIDSNKFDKITVAEKCDIPGILPSMVKENDIVLILGAGDIREIGPDIVNRLKDK
ncbi:MAG: UDP-N-acetylmuramate--L-alanine ligase [Candidatus Aadella gelida]|nr:UDP-N-acetylmuramate--L-alanine ligase [Candidatus Aadella gelida]